MPQMTARPGRTRAMDPVWRWIDERLGLEDLSYPVPAHANSVLYQIVQANPPWPGGNRMPLGGPYLDATQIQTIATWIDQGAKNN